MAEELAGPQIFSHNLTVETPIDIDDLIYVLSPIDLPLLQGINADGMPVLPRKPLSQVSFDWLEEEVPLPRATLSESGFDDTETDLTVGTGEAVKFAVGDGIRVDDEIMIVTAINTTTEVLTVTRGSLAETNTTAAAHALNSEVIGLGTILIEGAIGSANYQGRDKYSNYAQIWTKKINISATEQLIRKYGVPSELTHQTLNALQHMGQGIEQSALYGVKHRHASTYRRQTGGLDYFVTSNEDTTTDWITIAEIEDRQQTAYDNGGTFNLLMGKPSAFRALNNLAGTERIQTVTIDDARRGRRRATTVMTEFGDVTLVRNRWVKATEAFGFSRENFTYRVMRPMQQLRLAKTDDTDSFLMVCEGGFQVKGQEHMCKFTGLDTSAAFPTDLVYLMIGPTLAEFAGGILADPHGVVAQGMAILREEAEAAEQERRALVPDAQLEVLKAIFSELAMINNRLGALEMALYTPKVRVPVRDSTGRIVEVIEKIAEPEFT